MLSSQHAVDMLVCMRACVCVCVGVWVCVRVCACLFFGVDGVCSKMVLIKTAAFADCGRRSSQPESAQPLQYIGLKASISSRKGSLLVCFRWRFIPEGIRAELEERSRTSY